MNLQEQQKEAWRLAPDDALAVSQNSNGHWKSLQIVQLDHSFIAEYIVLFQSEINGWDWRDTLQSRKEFEEMKPSELDKANGDHKEDFVPEVGQVLLSKKTNTEYVVCAKYEEYVWARPYGENTNPSTYFIDSFKMPKSEAEKRRDEQKQFIHTALVEADAHFNWDTVEKLHNAGCRMTRDLTDDVAIMIATTDYSSLTDNERDIAMMKAAAAYVTGSGKYE